VNAVFWNMLLALAWTLMTGSLTAGNFAVGFVVGAIILFATQSVAGLPHYQQRVLRAVMLLGFTIVELVLANFRVARDVMRRQDQLQPGVIDLQLDAETDVELTLLAALVTLTPGSTAIEISGDRRVMYIHATNVRRGDIDAARREMKDGFERRLLEVTR
jgi:multicomponent Na+:H+ antiporter subunit E